MFFRHVPAPRASGIAKSAGFLVEFYEGGGLTNRRRKHKKNAMIVLSRNWPRVFVALTFVAISIMIPRWQVNGSGQPLGVRASTSAIR